MLLLLVYLAALVVGALIVWVWNMVLNTDGVVYLLEQERTILNTSSYHLYTNNYTPVVTSTAANFTECTDSGYASWTPGFTATVLNGSNQGETDGPQHTITFNFSPSVSFTVYGYYVTRASDNHLIFAELAPASFTVTAANQTYSVTPKKLMTSI